MSEVCMMTNATTTQKDNRRQVAWQVSSTLPLVILIACVMMPYAPAQFWQTASGLILLAAVFAAAVTDLRWYKIPNWLTYPAFCWGIAINALAYFLNSDTSARVGAVGIADCLAGALLPFFFMLVIFSLTGGGAGDVKLTAAMGALVGLNRVIDIVLISFIFAGGFALIRAIWVIGPVRLLELLYRQIGSWVLPLWIHSPTKEQKTFMKQPMPLGPAFALGAATVLFSGDTTRFWELL